ncbi:Arylsulfatase [Rubripirellula tenax]|uniref:Arylsulfatase n=1 Tax=Rubripirellula tenax TaxID=2528015 RepID=A0A5C6ERB6_9BACT|nr:arylsulfatase [Rubripirellula tenax]TWU50597.1 Arylsulfatase [Rubripirellula tenax]
MLIKLLKPVAATHLLLTIFVPLASANNTKPNVVFVFADDLGYGEVQALNPERGLIPTPHLDQLTEEGMVFTDAHTTSAVCTPSRYGLLTGRYAWRTRLQSGVAKGGNPCLIAPDRMTLGHLFQGQGYHTAIFGKWHLDYQYDTSTAPKGATVRKKSKTLYLSGKPIGTRVVDGPLTRGFDHFFGYHHGRSMSSFVEDDRITKEIEIIDVLPELTQSVTDYIDAKAADAKAGKPFFVYFPMSSPHSPVVPSKDWQGKSGLGDHGDFVMQTDASVGDIIKALERNGLTENTILVFSSDNGTSGPASNIEDLKRQGHYSSAHFRGEKTAIWDGGHRVPFILRWPARVQPKSEFNQMISVSDVIATFAELFEVELDDDTAEDSISFLSGLDGKEDPNPRQAIVHHSSSGRFAVRQGDWKLLLAPGSGGATAPTDSQAIRQGLPEMQLYNMKDDVSENTNLVAKYPQKVEALVALLRDYVAEGRSTPGAAQTNDAEIDIMKTHRNQKKERRER